LEDKTIFLNSQRRIFSSDPETVAQIVEAIVDGLNEKGIIPVLKHFPGEGRAKVDTHLKLSLVDLPKDILLERDILPYERLIKKKKNFWIMVGHSIYSQLDSKNPASLSFEIQTNFLRNELGFEGVIITDDLGQMGAIKEYAERENLKFPYYGEIVKRAFKAGSDMVILYLSSLEIVPKVIEEVKVYVENGELRLSDLDKSVERILKEKERIFKRSFKDVLKEMTIEEKIAQKIFVEIFSEYQIGILKKYGIGGVRVYNINPLKKLQDGMKIPLFVAAQHEGGLVRSHFPIIFTKSAYLVGKEIEGFGNQKISLLFKDQEKTNNLTFESLSNFQKSKVLKSILSLLQAETKKIGGECIGDCFLFDVDSASILRLVNFENLPREWTEIFPETNLSYLSYSLLKNLYLDWLEKEKKSFIFAKTPLEQLNSFIKYFQDFIERKSDFRVLVLATHPDDEDQIAISFFRNQGADVYLLLATRGESGENRINSLTGDDLGRLRTEEIERSGEILGVKKIYYLGAKDFGYCVSEKESFQHWNKKEMLRKIVYFYRLIKPHIIITKDNLSEHCQHKAFISLAKEAFDLSKKENVFWKMKKEGILPWQPLKFYQRSENDQGDLVINTQDKDIFSKRSYQEIAIESLKQHKSQGADFWPIQFPETVFYKLVKSKEELDVKEENIFEGELLPSGIEGIKISQRKIGLYEPNNNILFASLVTLGYEISRLSDADLSKEDLSDFDVIIVGQFVPKISFYVRENLMNFLKRGGVLIVFPQFDFSNDLFQLAPKPFKIEFSPLEKRIKIKILNPQHKIFNYPNKISLNSFKRLKNVKGWYFPKDYGGGYEELIEIKDLKNNKLKSGILVSYLEKGKYIFFAIDFYSLLRQYDLTALKILANIVSF
jgi:beta-glucosidase-like glycosyl hydrolase/LmbE family N-acetylglucosaminyl deacetylase